LIFENYQNVDIIVIGLQEIKKINDYKQLFESILNNFKLIVAHDLTTSSKRTVSTITFSSKFKFNVGTLIFKNNNSSYIITETDIFQNCTTKYLICTKPILYTTCSINNKDICFINTHAPFESNINKSLNHFSQINKYVKYFGIDRCFLFGDLNSRFFKHEIDINAKKSNNTNLHLYNNVICITSKLYPHYLAYYYNKINLKISFIDYLKTKSNSNISCKNYSNKHFLLLTNNKDSNIIYNINTQNNNNVISDSLSKSLNYLIKTDEWNRIRDNKNRCSFYQGKNESNLVSKVTSAHKCINFLNSFKEPTINFIPTYKYNSHVCINNYAIPNPIKINSFNKKTIKYRIYGYTDRIMYSFKNDTVSSLGAQSVSKKEIKYENYIAHPYFLHSDHLPVSCLFTLNL
jgi:hypothetical protein